ncbi:MAG: hypothetical protein AABX70_08405 [Nanoarchaeota archaeon]
MRVFWIIGISLLFVNIVLAQAPIDSSKILEFPTVYIYPYYWMFPVEGNDKATVSQVDSGTQDICGEPVSAGEFPVMAF